MRASCHYSDVMLRALSGPVKTKLARLSGLVVLNNRCLESDTNTKFLKNFSGDPFTFCWPKINLQAEASLLFISLRSTEVCFVENDAKIGSTTIGTAFKSLLMTSRDGFCLSVITSNCLSILVFHFLRFLKLLTTFPQRCQKLSKDTFSSSSLP